MKYSEISEIKTILLLLLCYLIPYIRLAIRSESYFINEKKAKP